MKNLVKVMVIVIAVLGTSLMAYDKGSIIKCIPYKIYNPKTELSYKLTKKEMKKYIYSVEVTDQRTLTEGKTEYRYTSTNSRDWDIFVSDDKDRATIAFKDLGQKHYYSGAIVLTGGSFLYSACKEIK